MPHYKLIIKYIFITAMFMSLTACATNKNTAIEETSKNEPSHDVVVVNGVKISVEIADEPMEWYQGLSDHAPLCENCGMLFVFPEYESRTFVMRNMLFPLDIIFIKDNRIINIERDLPPEGAVPEKRYESGEPVNYVLEVNGGYCQKNGIGEGDVVNIIN